MAGRPNFNGINPSLMQSIIKDITPNPETGQIDMLDIMRYVSQNPSQMGEFMAQVNNMQAESSNVDLSTYNFGALAPTIKDGTIWVVQIERMGMVDRLGHAVDPSEENTTPGLQPCFVIYCYDEKGSYRTTYDTIGLPSSSTVLQVVKDAIAKPLPPLKPSLPWCLMLSIKLQQHAEALTPFFNSLPKPFHWRLETAEEAEILNEGIHKKNVSGVRKGMESAEKFKNIGNKAFAQKDRATALKAYTDAAEHLLDALSQKPDIDDNKKVKKQLAICYANRAATYLIPGNGMDILKALRDGEAAEAADPSYAKAYIRQATAHQANGNVTGALDSIARALHRPDLENENGLVDRFIELQTDGKGFSDDEAIFKDWVLQILINDKESAKRLDGIKGEWRRRCDAQFAKWKK